ncbi:MAG: hydrogenase formation protein HypD [bacterium]|nr:hydrogenase formation protein HypD [bacterium]
MQFIDEYRDASLAKKILEKIELISRKIGRPVQLMEVCGTHTVAIFKSGIRELLPKNIKLLSGPGCPVCVTAPEDIDAAIAVSENESVILVTFGDMLRVPGTKSSLQEQKAEGKEVRIVYSCLDALEIAKQNPEKKVVFFAVGFETTSPTIAATVQLAVQNGIKNFYIYPAHKLIPPAMQALLESGEVNINGFICPGHVSAIIGEKPYRFIPEKYQIPCVIAGFEPLDILQAILMLLEQIAEQQAKVEIQYRRVVKPEGNPKAVETLYTVFEPTDVLWRGLGVIPNSGLKLKKEYHRFDVSEIIPLAIQFSAGRGSACPARKSYLNACRCGEVLRGVITPPECSLFRKKCTPENPFGPCMVSTEGTCAAYYKYQI